MPHDNLPTYNIRPKIFRSFGIAIRGDMWTYIAQRWLSHGRRRTHYMWDGGAGLRYRSINEQLALTLRPPPCHHRLAHSLTISHLGIKTPPADEIPSVGCPYYFYILPCWSVGLIMASAYQQTVTKRIKMVASVLHFCQRHWLSHWHLSSSGSFSNNRTLYLHIQWWHRWALSCISPGVLSHSPLFTPLTPQIRG